MKTNKNHPNDDNLHGKDMNRREFLRRFSLGAGSAVALMAFEPFSALAKKDDKKPVENRMTYRVQHGSGEQISPTA